MEWNEKIRLQSTSKYEGGRGAGLRERGMVVNIYFRK